MKLFVRNVLKFISRHVLIEIALLILLFVFVLFVFSVQSNGSLVGLADYYSKPVEDVLFGASDRFDQPVVIADVSHTLSSRSDIEGYLKPFLVSINCDVFGLSATYAKHSPTITYYVLIPAFFVIKFVYSNRSISDVSKIGRVLLAVFLVGILFVLTSQILELQEINSSLVNAEYRNAEDIFEKYLFGCYPSHLENSSIDQFISFSSVSIGNIKMLLVEVRVYILAITLWVLGRSFQDMRDFKSDIEKLRLENKND